MDFGSLTALEIGSMIKKREISVKEAVLSCLNKAKENKYNSFITVCESEALKRADYVQGLLDKGEKLSPLAGVPMAVKDNICTKNITTSCGSRMLSNFVPPYDATAYKRLCDAGAIIIGKTNMDEFAMGSTGETSFFGAAKNPLDITKSCGGSSSGSASAVCSGEAFFALGSDTGGSVRQPASFCGITGIKPTYGGVSRSGLVAYASSFDQIGPMAKNVKDAFEVLKIIWGKDEADSITANTRPLNFLLTGEIKGKRIALFKECFDNNVADSVKERVMAAAKVFTENGAEVREISFKELAYSVSAYYIIASAQASSNLARFDGIRYGYRAEAENLNDMFLKSRNEGFGKEVKKRILLGTFVLSKGYYDDYYKKALNVCGILKEKLEKIFEDYDAVLMPVCTTSAPTLGCNEDSLKMYMNDVFTVIASLGGFPAVSLPCGKDENGMPIGFQLMGKAFDEESILNLAQLYENATDFHKKGERK